MKFISYFLLLAVVCSNASFGDQVFTHSDLPKELEESAPVTTGQLRNRETLQFPEIQFQPLAHQKTKVVLPGLKELSVSQMPTVPYLVKKLVLRKGTRAFATLEKLQVEVSVNPLLLKLVQSEIIWGASHAFNFGNQSHQRYFPGKFLINSEDSGVASATIFPVQYDKQTGKIVVLRNAGLAFHEIEVPRHFAISPVWSSAAVIITSESLLPAAKRLQQFHADKFSMKSEIVTVESLAKSEPMISESELPEGYKSRDLVDDTVQAFDASSNSGYNYSLARKIIHYLQSRMDDGGVTKYVTILGDATLVPPSYYFSAGGQIGVTDECYGAVKKCLSPKLAVGRLPFQSLEQLDNYLSKVSRWLEFSAKAKSELSLYGGKAFPMDVYIAELGTLKTINSSSDNWRGLKKYFRTRKTYTKEAVLNLVKGKSDSSIIYHLDHGGGNTWGVENQVVSSTEILSASDAGPTVNPFITSIACTDAAFDTALLKNEILSDGRYGDVSIGVALLQSKAGAVGYLGSARPALGQPVYEVDSKGNLSITGTTYGLQLLDTFLAKYEIARGGRVGDSLLQSLRAYADDNGNDMTQEENRYAFLNEELLGDPVMPLPSRTEVEQNFGPAKSLTKFTGSVTSESFPHFDLTVGQTLSLDFEASCSITASLFKLIRTGFSTKERLVQEGAFDSSGKIPLNFEEEGEGTYFLRLENQKGVPVERQIWFEAVR